MIAKVYSAIPQGYDGRLVEIEGDTNQGLPSFNIVGMANRTVSEARERVRAAITNSGFTFPAKKVTINLAPAELAKDGSHLDLPIALAILALSQQLLAKDLASSLFVGELSLNGQIKPVRGIINVVEAAKNAGFKAIYLPAENLTEAALVDGLNIIGVSDLQELFRVLKGEIAPNATFGASMPDGEITPSATPPTSAAEPPQSPPPDVVKNTKTGAKTPILAKNDPLAQIHGQILAKRALTIAVAGHHNILFTGPPGSGKTMLAKAALELLPPPTREEQIEIAKLHSLINPPGVTIAGRPFRTPHHTSSSAAIIGGGQYALPGEISLAHQGILFLDELPEYPRSVLEALRQPLEDRTISISRAENRMLYPANFMLIATMNPCPCGFFGDPHHECQCTSGQIRAYMRHLSGPLLDRIDLVVHVDAVSSSDLATIYSPENCKSTNVVKNTKTEVKTPKMAKSNKNTAQNAQNSGTNTADLAQNPLECIIRARQIQRERYQGSGLYNSSLHSRELIESINLSSDAHALLKSAAERLKLSARSYFKVLRVARTIADLDAITEVGVEQISEALAYRESAK